jgi:hypothetical protein
LPEVRTGANTTTYSDCAAIAGAYIGMDSNPISEYPQSMILLMLPLMMATILAATIAKKRRLRETGSSSGRELAE